MILYEHRGGLYVNLTARCPTACAFCIKKEWDWRYHGQDLRLGGGEPSIGEILRELDERLKTPVFRELVFCGYGEPTMRMDALCAAARRARRLRPELSLRLNTVGLGSLVNERDVVPELAEVLDSVSVSLNAADPARWEELHRPRPDYRGRGFSAALAFIRGCAAAGLRTRVTAVELPGTDLDAVRALARTLGAGFAARPALSPREKDAA